MSFTVVHVSTETAPTQPASVVTRLAVALLESEHADPNAWAVRVQADQSDDLLVRCRPALQVVTHAATVVSHSVSASFEPLQNQLSRLGLEPLQPASLRDTQALTRYVEPAAERAGIRAAMRAVGAAEANHADRYHALGPGGDPERLDDVLCICRLYLQLARLGRNLGFEPDLTPTASVRWGMAIELVPDAETMPAFTSDAA